MLISKELLLNDFDLNGSVFTTPGHTWGSLSVLLRTGEAFIGDLAVNFFPAQSVFPTYAEDTKEVLKVGKNPRLWRSDNFPFPWTTP